MTCHSDFLPDDYKFEDLASMHTLEKLETMIRICSLPNKEELIKKISGISEPEAIEMMNSIQPYLPRYNSEAIAHTVNEQKEAIKNAVEKDDFYESRYKK